MNRLQREHLANHLLVARILSAVLSANHRLALVWPVMLDHHHTADQNVLQIASAALTRRALIRSVQTLALEHADLTLNAE